MPSACFYANCEPAVGAGHLLRSVALAEETAKLGFNVHVLAEYFPSGLEQRLADALITTEIVDVDDAPCLLLQKASQGIDIWVFDSYKLPQSFLSEFARQYKTTMIDDEGWCAVPEAKAIINPNAWAKPDLYAFYGEGPTQFLCGPEYVLFRHEVRARKWAPPVERPQQSILVAPGGTDATGVGPYVVRLLQDHFTGGIEVRESFSQAMKPSEFVDALASVDVAVVGCGTTLWEATSIGVPVVGLLVADNQEKSAEFVRSREWAEVIDCREAFPGDRLVEAVEKQLNTSRVGSSATVRSSSIIDGWGAERVARVLRQIEESPS